jgi:hypothetical protein
VGQFHDVLTFDHKQLQFHIDALGRFTPSRLSRLRSYFVTLFLGHGLEPPFPPDLTTFAAYGGHVLGDVRRNRGTATGRRIQGNFWLWRLVSRTIYNPLGKLVRIAWALSLSDSHDSLLGSGLSSFRRDICFSNSADLVMSLAACSISSIAVARSFSASWRSSAELGLSCAMATMMPQWRMLKRDCGN